MERARGRRMCVIYAVIVLHFSVLIVDYCSERKCSLPRTLIVDSTELQFEVPGKKKLFRYCRQISDGAYTVFILTWHKR